MSTAPFTEDHPAKSRWWRAVLAWLPQGNLLPDTAWARRHRVIVALLWLQVPALLVMSLLRGFSFEHGILDALVVLLCALYTTVSERGRAVRSITAAVGLLTACAVYVHLSDGLIETHFLFFIMVGIITLYQDWRPFLVAVAFVALHHGAMGAIDPQGVYNHSAAWNDPWGWALIHALFILGMSAVSIVAWKLNEDLHRTIQVSEARFRGHFEHAAVGEAMMSVDGRFLEVNQALCSMLGYCEAELLERDWREITHPGDREQTDRQVQRLLAGDIPSFDLEKRYTDSRGDSIFSLTSMSIVRSGSGDPQYLTSVIQDITERKSAEAALEHQALHDALTGLPNRALLMDRIGHSLQRATRTGSRVALLFLDLDRFKWVNDSLGHAAGDEILLVAAARLKAHCRDADTIARIGGDEFVILCEDLTTDGPAIATAQRLLEAMGEPFETHGRRVTVTASLGIAIAGPGDPATADVLLSNADAAMYRAKDNGRNRWVQFDATMRGRALERLEVETQLRTALTNGELVVHYQPVMDVATREAVGVEALVRWQHPTRGLVSPGEFIPLAEETGLIVPLGRLVLERACATVGAWNAERVTQPLTLAVNVAAKQFLDPDFPDMVRSVLETSELDPAHLCLEITETALLEDLAVNDQCLQRLTDLGLKIGVDDFGTGYSSLVYLKHFPVGVVKIDRSFTKGIGTDEHDSAIVGAVVNLARALGLHTIAEGVERPEQLIALAALQCEAAQGFFWTPALPEAEFRTWLDAHSETMTREAHDQSAPTA